MPFMFSAREDGRSRGKAFAVAKTRVDSCFRRNDKRGRQVMTGKGRSSKEEGRKDKEEMKDILSTPLYPDCHGSTAASQ